MKLLLLFVGTTVLVAGCGFKSELYLPDRSVETLPETLPEIPPSLTELPALPTAEDVDTPGVPVEIPSLEEQKTNNKKQK